MTIELNDKKRRLIEELGVIQEAGGIQPAAARIMALLLVADETELTFEEIYETLGMSKSAASNALNLMLNTGKIEYITRSGERKRYFRFKIKSIRDGINKVITDLENLNNVLKKVLEQRPVGTREFNASLDELIRFNEFIRLELPALIVKWNNMQS
jgi:DNA-binding transcriptional regulator GbsR (MarR family)